MNFSKKKTIICTLIMTVILCLCFTSCVFKNDVIAEGVRVAGIDVGNMKEAEAVSVLKKYEDFASGNVVLGFKCEDTEFEVPATQLELRLNAEESAKAAYLAGRGKDKKENKEQLKKIRKEGLNIAPVLYFDTDKFLLTAGDYLGDKITDPSPMRVEYGTDCLIVTNARPGRIISVGKLTEALCNELIDLKADSVIEVELEDYTPDNLTFEEFVKEYVKEAKDAVYTKEGGTHNIEPEVIGVELDTKEAKKIFEENKNSDESYKIPAKITRPSVTASYLEDKYVNKVIAKYSTSFAGSSAGRCANIALAAEKIDGYVLNPGDRFSYNRVVGPRTAEAGFKTAHVYVGTKVVDGIGGGICQVSSTLYNAVVMADLKTVSRTNHSIPVNYVPLGRDATVSYGTIDYVFENNKNYPVSIKAKIEGTTLTVSVVGTSEEDYTVEFVSGYVSSIPYATTQREDASIPEGETKVITAGSNGSVYESYRVYKRNGKEYDRKFESKSRYQPITAEVAVGTKKEAEEEAPVTDENTEPPVAEEQPEEIPEVEPVEPEVPEEAVPEETPETEIVHPETQEEPVIVEPEVVES